MTDIDNHHYCDKCVHGLDHVRAASRHIRRRINTITDVRLSDGQLSGRALDDHLKELIEIEGDLSRAEGSLSD